MLSPRAPSRFLAKLVSTLTLLVLACSSSSKTVATDSCSPGEVTECALASGCDARKTCNADGRTYAPCQCIADGGAGRGGMGATSGRGGTGPAGSAGAPPGGTAGVSPGGSGGGPAGTAGVGGLPPGGSAGSAGGPVGGSAGAPPIDGGPGGAAGTGGGGTVDSGQPCLNCTNALQAGLSPNDPRICTASRNTYATLYNCACTSSACSTACGMHCVDQSNPFNQTCQDCILTTCPNVITACMNDG